MKNLSRNFVLLWALLVSGQANAGNLEVVHSESFFTTVNLNHLSCSYVPDGDFTRESIILRIDREAFDFRNVATNDHLGIYGMDTSVDLLPMGLNCDVIADLWRLSDNGILSTIATRTIRKGVDSSYRSFMFCERGYHSEIAVELTHGLTFREERRYQMQLANWDRNCDEELPLLEAGRLKLHVRAASNYGLHCTWAQGGGYAMQFETNFSSTARPKHMISESTFESRDACEAKVAELFAMSETDDPDNRGQYLDTLRSHQTVERLMTIGNVRKSRLVVDQELKAELYGESFLGKTHFVIR